MNFIEYNTQSAQNRLKNPRFLHEPVKKIRDAARAPENLTWVSAFISKYQLSICHCEPA